MGLRVAPELELPPEAVTDTFAILAKKRAGKSNAAVRIAEAMYDADLPWVAIDPKGDWYGVRSNADGNGPGLAVPVLGGLHGDVPLDPREGGAWAEIVAEHRLTAVFDLSEMSKGEQIKFLTPFAERLLRVNREPLHLFLEECDEYVPQRVMGEEARLVGAISKLVRRGGFRGIGTTLITQRSALVNKDVLTQTETLVVLRTTSPQDRAAVKAWLEHADVPADLMSSLASLENGEAWVASPHSLGLSQPIRVHFERRRTFDSGQTPKVGEARRLPSRLADVDLAAIKEAMADSIQRAEADDPKVLRRRIAELERQVTSAPTAEPEVVEVERVVEVAPEWLPDLLRQVLDRTGDVLDGAERVREAAQDVLAKMEAERDRQDVPRARQPSGGPRAVERARPAQRADPSPRREPRSAPVPRSATDADTKLSKAQRAILSVLAQYPDGRTHRQVAMLTGYSGKGGGFNNALSALRSAGLAIGGKANLQATEAGLDALGDWDPLPTGPDLLDHWLDQLGKAERLVLSTLADHWPDTLTKDTLADVTGYAVSGGGFNNALSRLRTLELVEGSGELRASDDLMAGVR